MWLLTACAPSQPHHNTPFPRLPPICAAVVVTPLLSLMQDQVQALNGLPSGGVPTTYISSQQTVTETRVSGQPGWRANGPPALPSAACHMLLPALAFCRPLGTSNPHMTALCARPARHRFDVCARGAHILCACDILQKHHPLYICQAVFMELGKPLPTIKLLYVTPEQLVKGERLRAALQ